MQLSTEIDNDLILRFCDIIIMTSISIVSAIRCLYCVVSRTDDLIFHLAQVVNLSNNSSQMQRHHLIVDAMQTTQSLHNASVNQLRYDFYCQEASHSVIANQ